MIRLLNKVPNDITVAVSGGIDSMAALSFLNNSRRKVTAAYFDHGTPYSPLAKNTVQEYCASKGIQFVCSKIDTDIDPTLSLEEFWRIHRYQFFSSFKNYVVTAHHLDDVAEWWVFSSFHGQSRLIPYKNKNVIRPFLLTPKSRLAEWVLRNDVPYIEDPSNEKLNFRRNFIRHKMMPDVLEINPGIHTMLRKKMLSTFKEEIKKKNV